MGSRMIPINFLKIFKKTDWNSSFSRLQYPNGLNNDTNLLHEKIQKKLKYVIFQTIAP